MFSRAVRSISNPAPSSISGATLPRTVTLPRVGQKMPEITFKRVLLPQPFSPTMANGSPRFTVKLTLRRA